MVLVIISTDRVVPLGKRGHPEYQHMTVRSLRADLLCCAHRRQSDAPLAFIILFLYALVFTSPENLLPT